MKNLFARVRKEFEYADETRERVIKGSRDVLRGAKKAIVAAQRGDVREAKKLLLAAEKARARLGVHSTVGAFTEAGEEFVEASCFVAFVEDKELPAPEVLHVDVQTFLGGVCDCTGEVARFAINSVVQGKYGEAVRAKSFVDEVYTEIMLLTVRNSPLRRKLDAVKYSVEKLESLILELKLKGLVK